MEDTVQIHIPNPCHVNWNTMSPESLGRFCNSCQKTVLDFTQCSDEEILIKLQSTTQVCGRFREDQLHRPLHNKASLVHTAMATAVLSIMTLSSNETYSQEQSLPGKILLGEPAIQVRNSHIKGKIVLENSQPQKVKITRANKDEISTNEKGEFDLWLIAGEIITISSPMYRTVKYQVPEENVENLVIELKETPMVMGKFIQHPQPNSK